MILWQGDVAEGRRGWQWIEEEGSYVFHIEGRGIGSGEELFVESEECEGIKLKCK